MLNTEIKAALITCYLSNLYEFYVSPQTFQILQRFKLSDILEKEFGIQCYITLCVSISFQ